MNQSPRHLIKLLEKKGFVFKRSKDSHQLFYNHSTHTTIIVPVHGNKDKKRELFWLS